MNNKELSIKEIQTEEKKILDKVVKFLDTNDIKYFLYAGTLLGAIRHKGFIPWDDDIDIAIPRPDYNKLQKIIKKKNKLDNNIYFHSDELGNLNMPFTKVYNYNIKIDDWRYKDRCEKYLWIDLFPIDGLPDVDDECYKKYQKRDFYKMMLMIKKMSVKYIFSSKRNFFIKLLKVCLKFLLMFLPSNYLSKKIVALANLNNYSDSNYVGNVVWGYGPQEKLEKKVYEEYIKVEFEGAKYNGLKNYDDYLSKIYGDYMTLPKEEDRVTHNLKAWSDKNEK